MVQVRHIALNIISFKTFENGELSEISEGVFSSFGSLGIKIEPKKRLNFSTITQFWKWS